MGIFDLIQLIATNIWVYGGAFLLVLSILVFVHEWGHFIIARMCGVRVEVFSIGFGPELFGFTSKTGTRWKFSAIPLGGYVKMFGDVDPASAGHDDTVKDKDGHVRTMSIEERSVAFFAKSVWQRAAIVFAGPAINYIFAIIIMMFLFTIHGKPISPPIAGAVIVGSAADKAGFNPHDEIIKIDDKSIETFDDVRREMIVGLDQERHFVVRRDGEMIDLYATPERIEQQDRFGFKHTRGMLGLISSEGAVPLEAIKSVNGRIYSDKEELRAPLSSQAGKEFVIGVSYGNDTNEGAEGEDQEDGASDSSKYRIKPPVDMNTDITTPNTINHNLLFLYNEDNQIIKSFSIAGSFREAVRESWNLTTGTLSALGQIIVGTRSTKELGGLPRIGAVAGDMAKQGVVALIMFAALLSINLGLINLFPIPVLDGGHLVFYAFEAVLGRPIPERVQDVAFQTGFVFLIGVMVYANLNDIMQLILKT